MFAGIGAYIASEVSGAVRRNTIIYGLFGLVGLLLVCMAGYLVDAIHTMLAVRHGGVAASLIVAAGFLVLALVALGIALYVKNRPRPARPVAKTALLAAPLAMRLMSSRMTWRMGVFGGAIVLAALVGRQFFKGSDSGEDES